MLSTRQTVTKSRQLNYQLNNTTKKHYVIASRGMFSTNSKAGNSSDNIFWDSSRLSVIDPSRRRATCLAVAMSSAFVLDSNMSYYSLLQPAPRLTSSTAPKLISVEEEKRFRRDRGPMHGSSSPLRRFEPAGLNPIKLAFNPSRLWMAGSVNSQRL